MDAFAIGELRLAALFVVAQFAALSAAAQFGVADSRMGETGTATFLLGIIAAHQFGQKANAFIGKSPRGDVAAARQLRRLSFCTI